MAAPSLPDASLAFDGPDLFHLAFVLLAGRVTLACLPPGNIGGHSLVRPSQLAITLTASAVLGFLVAWLLSPLPNAVAWSLVLVVCIARVVSLPGAMVPRHEPPVAAKSLWVRVFTACIILLLALLGAAAADWVDLPAWSQARAADVGSQLRAVLGAAGIVVLMDYGARVARRTHAFALALALLFLLSETTNKSLFATPAAVESAFLVAAGCAFTVAWLRRADRRARFLAIAAYVGLATFAEHGLGLALAGLAGLLAFTPKPSLLSTARLSVVGLSIAFVFGRVSIFDLPTEPSALILDSLRAVIDLSAYPLFALLTLLGLLRYAGQRDPVSAEPDSTRREAGAALFALASALLASAWSTELLVPLAVLAYFAVLLSILPAEQSNTSAGSAS